MGSSLWREVGRNALAGALAGASLAVLGLRVGADGALQPVAAAARLSDERADVPRDALAVPDRHEETQAVVRQALVGGALGALYGYLRARAEQEDGPPENRLYGTLLSAVGLGAWLAPLGLADRADDQPPRDEWSYHPESLLDDDAPPYETQPPYDPDSPYDAF